MATRPEMRAAVRGAVDLAPEFSGFARWIGWGRNRDGKALPAVDVHTPRFTVRDVAAGKREVTTDLLLLVRRQAGDDLEDLLDADAAAFEAAVLPALSALCDDVELSQGENDVPGVGEQRVGTMMLTFRCTTLTDRPT